MKRIDHAGTNALVQLPVPVSHFPDFVRDAAERLNALGPQPSKVQEATFDAQ